MENWMSRIDDSKKIILINIPGTHDSTAYCMNRISFKCANTQELTIAQQLEIGIRDFDIRIVQSHNDTSQDEDIICCHGICDCYVSPNFCDNRKLTYKSVLLDIKNFLEKNPSETVLMGTNLGRGKWKNGYMLVRAYQLFDKYVGNIAIRFKSDLLMGEVRGKVITYTSIIEEFDSNDNMMRTKTRKYLPCTAIYDVHRKYQNCATFII